MNPQLARHYRPAADTPNTVGFKLAARVADSEIEPVFEVALDDAQCHVLRDSFLQHVQISTVLLWRDATDEEQRLFDLKRSMTMHSKRCPFCKSVRITSTLEFHRCLDCKTCFEFGAELKTTLADEDPTHVCSLCDKKAQVQA